MCKVSPYFKITSVKYHIIFKYTIFDIITLTKLSISMKKKTLNVSTETKILPTKLSELYKIKVKLSICYTKWLIRKSCVHIEVT